MDKEIRRIIDQQYALARKLIEDNRDKIEAMTKALLEWETIDADQINDIMEGRAAAPAQAQSEHAATRPRMTRRAHRHTTAHTPAQEA